jgi:DNA repair exonuclease SbcCD ATPase subunit
MSKIEIPEYAKLKVYWDDRPENYSRESKLKVRNYFSKKYNVDKNNINVIYRAVKTGTNGEMIEITGAGVDNIMDREYQVKLMHEWYTREGKTVDFDRLIALDTKVNGSLSSAYEGTTHRSWDLKWLYIDNFLCFGDSNFVSFGNLDGLNIVTSEPLNQGGKTTFSVDAIKFLLYGRTTKTDKNEQIFNSYREKNSLSVRGMLEIDGEEIILERVLSRTAKKSGGWTVVNKLTYYKLLPDGEEDSMDEENSKVTTEKIKQTIGDEKDFDITILATARNLEDLVDAKPTESGKLLIKFIGLEIIEEKEEIAKKFNTEFNKAKKGNQYNIVTLSDDITNQNDSLKLYGDALEQLDKNLEASSMSLTKLETKKDNLFNSKLSVDVVISQLNPETIEKNINTITADGLVYKGKIDTLVVEIKELEAATYDEDLYHSTTKQSNTLHIAIGKLEGDIVSIGTLIDNLENSEICQSCKRPLDNVDNNTQITEAKNLLKTKSDELVNTKKTLTVIDDKIGILRTNKLSVDKRNRLELEKDKCEVEIGALRNKITLKKLDLKKYKANEESIKRNIDIDSDISSVKTDIVVETRENSLLVQKIFTTKTSITSAEEVIVFNTAMIKTLKGEEEVEKIFKVYLEMIGKKGISKLVLRSALPIINSELQRLLDEVCDFEVELIITDKNEVDYILIKSGIEKPLKSGSGFELTVSSIALRCVLGKISHLPMPNFITFDEVLGKVSNDNLDKMRPMFEKIKDMYGIVFLITHNELVKDWGDRIIMVKKESDISTINIK